MPDTPAPVFAARAIKNALWGQSTVAEDALPATTNHSNNTERDAATTQAIPMDTRSPTKLNSILLTPGTGTSRRKRVSFGRDVKTTNNNNNVGDQARKKTTLQQALEKSRPTKSREPEPEVEQPEADTDEEWEWEDEDMCCNHDLTVDLNEPHSESGKYWKAEWARYREEAKSDIEQLVKYKANAKSFAAKKDMEASQLSQRLKEEQAKVLEMEKKVADMATKLAATRKHGTDVDSASTTIDLATQTALVAEYREKVKDLELRLKEARSESTSDRHSRQPINTSPRTEQSIIEVSRELRKARAELRQMDRLRDEVKRLKSNLATSRERVAELEAHASSAGLSESSRVGKLETQLREAKDESRQKDADIRKLQQDYESLKRDAKARTAEAMQVLQSKNAKIDELEKKLKDIESASASSRPKGLDAIITEHNRITQDLKAGIKSLGKTSRGERSRPINRHVRAASVEDISLDMTQRSLLRNKDDNGSDNIRRQTPYGGGILTEWTADIPTFELQVKDSKTQEEEGSENPKEMLIPEGINASPSRQATRRIGQRTFHGSQRTVSDVLSNRVNESSRRQARRYRQANMDDRLSTNRDQGNASGRTAGARAASLAEDNAAPHDGLDPPTRRSRALSRITRLASAGSEAPGIDLVQDRFSRLGGLSADRSALANASRCTLPAERQSAARARLEQKRMERRKASGQSLDKENVRP